MELEYSVLSMLQLTLKKGTGNDKADAFISDIISLQSRGVHKDFGTFCWCC